jgi:hypothetical protein
MVERSSQSLAAFSACLLRGLLVAGEQDDDVAVRPEALRLEAEERGRDRDYSELVVDRAAAVEIAVFLDELEGIALPILPPRLDHVHMGEDQDRLAARRARGGPADDHGLGAAMIEDADVVDPRRFVLAAKVGDELAHLPASGDRGDLDGALVHLPALGVPGIGRRLLGERGGGGGKGQSGGGKGEAAHDHSPCPRHSAAPRPRQSSPCPAAR